MSSTQRLRLLTEQLERARAEALLDPLTGLRNRRGFERAIEELGGMGDAAFSSPVTARGAVTTGEEHSG